jgi:hypothetical protein
MDSLCLAGLSHASNDRLSDAKQTINDFVSILTPEKTTAILKAAKEYAHSKDWI